MKKLGHNCMWRIILLTEVLGLHLGTPLSVSASAQTQDIERWLADQTSASASPDASFLLTKVVTTPFAPVTTVESLARPMQPIVYTQGCPLLISWRPGTNEIWFVQDAAGNYRFRLFRWNFLTAAPVGVKAPSLATARRLMQWSNDGSTIAFSGDRGFPLLSLNATDGKVRMLRRRDFDSFGWAPVGFRMAGVDSTRTLYLSETPGGMWRSVTAQTLQSLLLVKWNSETSVIASGDPHSGERSYPLVQIDLHSGETSTLWRLPSEVRDFLVISPSRCLVRTFADGYSSFFECTGAQVRPAIKDQGYVNVLGLAKDQRMCLVEFKSPTVPRGIFWLDLETRELKLVKRFFDVDNHAPVAPTLVRLQPADPTNNERALVWRSPVQPSRGVVVRFPTGSWDQASADFDGGIQYLISQGLDYIAFSTPSNVEPDKIAIDVIEYARRVLGHANEHMVFVAESSGTTYLAKVASQISPRAGGMVLTGLVNARGVHVGANHYRITVFQGENDSMLSPLAVKSAIGNTFGQDSVTEGRVTVDVLAGEGHSPRAVSSRAKVIEAILDVAQ